jgi:hypothetical protein
VNLSELRAAHILKSKDARTALTNTPLTYTLRIQEPVFQLKPVIDIEAKENTVVLEDDSI